MAGLTGTQIKATYGDVLQCNHTGLGIDATVRIIQDGLGNNSALALSTGTVRAIDAPGTHTIDIVPGGDSSWTITGASGQITLARGGGGSARLFDGGSGTGFSVLNNSGSY